MAHRRTSPAGATRDEDDPLRPAETYRRLAEWLLRHDPASRGPSDAKGAQPSSSARSGGANPQIADEQRMFAPIRHLMFADGAGHDADRCRACAVARVALTIESHDEERPAWRDMLPFLKEVSAAIAAVAALQRAAAERAAAQRPTTAEAWAPLDMNARHVEVKRFTSAEMCRHIDPLLEFTKGELERFRESLLSLFDSPDHAVLPKANPPHPTLKSITTALYRAGFTAKEIVMLVDDGGDQDLASPKSKEFADAVGRVYKRIPSNGTAARKTTPKAPDSTRRQRKRSQR